MVVEKMAEALEGISSNVQNALKEIRTRIFAEIEGIKELILYGSVARGDADRESDVDLLVLTDHPFTRKERHRVTDLVFEINLDYETNFSTLVVDITSWETGMFTVLPLKDEIARDGIRL